MHGKEGEVCRAPEYKEAVVEDNKKTPGKPPIGLAPTNVAPPSGPPGVHQSNQGKLGQQTGHATQRDVAREAKRLVEMIMPALLRDEYQGCRVFVLDMKNKVQMYGDGLIVSTRQLGRLRDIKDKMVEAGHI